MHILPLNLEFQNGRPDTPRASGSNRPNGLRASSASRAYRSSMARIICRPRSAMPRPNISPVTFRARCSSISTRSPTTPPICRICCLGLGQFGKAVGAARHRRNRHHRRLRRARAVLGAARVVDVPHHGREERVHPGWRPAGLEGGKPPDRTGRNKAQAYTTFNADMKTGAVAMHGDVQMALNGKDIQVVDARPAGRFAGQRSGAAPRPAPRPHAGRLQLLPSSELVENGKLVAPGAALRAALQEGRRRHSTSRSLPACGSGVSAVILALASRCASARSCRRSMTAPGRNGARGPICAVEKD